MKLGAPQVLTLVVVVLAGIVAALWLATSEESVVTNAAGSAPLATSAREAPVPREPLAPAEPPRDSPPEAARAPVESPEETSATDTRVDALGQGLVVAGALLVHEPDGSVRRDANGTMDLILWLGGGGSRLPVDVVEGRWSGRLVERPEGGFSSAGGGFHREGVQAARISAQTPALTNVAGTVVLVDPDQRFGFGDEDVVVHVRLVTSVLVSVEDAQTGAGLDGVSILAIGGWQRHGHGHPGDMEGGVLAENASSPIELTPTPSRAARGTTTCLVGSPGYAWAAVEIDFKSGGERRVRLERGGDLEVFLQGDRGQPGAELRLRSAGLEQPFASQALEGDGPLVFQGLAPGNYGLRVEVGHWWDSPLVLARGEAEVVAAGVEQITLVLGEAPGLVEAPLSGRIVLPGEWGFDSFYVSLRLLDTPLDGSDGRRALFPDSLPRVPGTDEYTFDVGDVQVGKYSLTLGQLEYGMVFDLGPAGRSDVTLVVPPPVEVTILLRDEVTGRAAAVDSLLWNCKRPPGVRGGGLERVGREPGADRFRLRVPRTEITIRVQAREYHSATRTFLAEDGLDLVFEVRRSAAAIVQLRDGDTNVPWPENDYGKAVAVTGEGKMGSRGRRRTGLWFTVTEPGRYRIEIPRVAGFAPHDPVEVDLVTGETKVVRVDLERLP